MPQQSEQQEGKKRKILVVLGTRPEAVKLAPVINALRAAGDTFTTRVVTTSQHRDLVDPILRFFSITANHDLNVMAAAQTPSEVMANVLRAIEQVYRNEHPDMVMVQGDTTSAVAAALGAFYMKIPVAHVEAGLRTADRYSPFPEEMNRRLITQIASLHLAATEGNRAALRAEHVAPESIVVTGNPVIDALRDIIERPVDERDALLHGIAARPGARIILLTTHRRENFGEPQRHIFEAVCQLVQEHDDIEIAFPVHPNPAVTDAVARHLRPHPRIHLLQPVDYIRFVHLMNCSYLILTDSGGIQEEAPALGKPVLVLRDNTEREEMLASGNGLLVGTSREAIVERTNELLADREMYERMAVPAFPFGEGGAAARIVEAMRGWGPGTGDQGPGKE
jgi:UDP-N-acetylglucosamine 2-epimerase (non-hydrolysing)